MRALGSRLVAPACLEFSGGEPVPEICIGFTVFMMRWILTLLECRSHHDEKLLCQEDYRCIT